MFIIRITNIFNRLKANKMKKLLFILLFGLISFFGFSQEKYNYTEEIKSTTAKIKQAENLVKQEFGEPSSPRIWTSKDSKYGLMIRTKGDTFYIRAWQVSNDSDIKTRVEKLMDKVKNTLK